jgi:hypothetical protein
LGSSETQNKVGAGFISLQIWVQTCHSPGVGAAKRKSHSLPKSQQALGERLSADSFPFYIFMGRGRKGKKIKAVFPVYCTIIKKPVIPG